MAGQRDTWRDTRLWEELLDREGEPALRARRLLEDVLPPVEIVLDKGGTTGLNMTLHEAEHSWRVARWMAEIAGEEVLQQLQPYDLAMLLLSAYLHDIGMTPEAARVEDLLDFLSEGKPRSLSAEDVEELQEWLDEEWNGLVPPIDRDDEPSRLSREIVAGYVRHRHNDWSAPWIREYLRPNAERLYDGWVEDLIRLCQSHHFGLEELKGAGFDPRRVDGTAETLLHLRYCACLLRLADILDFDPERSPPILFKHRNIKGESITHWRKSLGAKIVRHGDQLQLEARPLDALAHRAILQTVADVERELAICQQLDDETSFQHLPGVGRLPHRWSLDLGVKTDVKPRHDAYEYIDGSFRPDVQKLLKLLGGTALYGRSKDAIRELLQNAFDAVREQIARERLNSSEPGATETGERISTEHSISLVLESSESGVKLICRDSGVGMSKQGITDRFLVGGKTSGHDLLRLERVSREAGFSVGRTAQFGIGVLSYFMLAERLTMRTRPSDESSAPSEPGWTFTSFGLADFGELEATPIERRGTEVELEIKPEELGSDPERFAEEVAAYVAETVKRAPCRFSFSAPGLGVPELSFGPGWQDEERVVRNALLSEFGAAEYLDEEDRRGRAQGLAGRTRERLELTVEEGDLPQGLGRYRIFLGHFRLDAGRSVAYMDLEQLDGDRYLIERIGDGDGWTLPSNLRFSWNGMHIGPEWGLDVGDEGARLIGPDRHTVNAYVQIDLTSNEAGRLAVARNGFAPSAVTIEAVSFVYERAKALWGEFADANRDSALALLNAHLIERFPTDLKAPPFWAQALPVEGETRLVLAPLELPAICIGDDLETFYRDSFAWKGSPVAPAIAFNITDEHEPKRNHRSWFGGLFGPQHVGALATDDRLDPVLVWERLEPNDLPSGDKLHCPPKFARFPPEWKALATLRSVGDRSFLNAWNRDNPIAGAVDGIAWEWAMETFVRSLDPLPHREEILRAPARVAAWILFALYDVENDPWNDLAKREAGFVDEAWGLIDGLGDDDEVYSASLQGGSVRKVFNKDGATTVVRVLTRRKWWTEPLDDPLALKRKLGCPDEEWMAERTGKAPDR